METFWKINPKLLPPKIHYFAYFAGVAALWPFVQVCGRQLGISELNIGIIFTAAPVFGIICNPLLGAIADKYRIKRKIFLIFMVINTAALLCFAFLPYRVARFTEDNDALLHACKDGEGKPRAEAFLSRRENETVKDSLLDPLEVSLLEKNRTESKNYEDALSYDSAIFWVYIFLIIVGWVSMAVVTSIADALCFQTLGKNHHLYGFQRIWGAVGWGGATFLAGYLIDVMSIPNQPKNYSPCFYLVAVFMLINLIVCCYWNVQEEGKPKSMAKDLGGLILQPRICVFILACIIVGICTGLQWNFLYWYVEDLASFARTEELECEYLQNLKLIQGVIAATQCLIGEVPFFYLSGWFIKKLGHVHCISLVLAAFGLRFVLYSVVTNPWMVVPIELLQGLTYGIFYATMASYAFIVSPPGTGATVQSFVAAAFEGVGVGLGSLIAGGFFKVFSGRMTFRLFGIFAVVAAALHVVTMLIIDSKSVIHKYDVPKGTQEASEKPETTELNELKSTSDP